MGGPAAPTAAASSAAFAPITAYSGHDVVAQFAFSKAGPANEVDITATYTNRNATPVTDFVLQARTRPCALLTPLRPLWGGLQAPMDQVFLNSQGHV